MNQQIYRITQVIIASTQRDLRRLQSDDPKPADLGTAAALIPRGSIEHKTVLNSITSNPNWLGGKVYYPTLVKIAANC